MANDFDSTICKECNVDLNSKTRLHMHLRAHKIRMSAYYHKHYPRYDKLTGELIEFKDLDHYTNHDFNSRENMAQWLKSASQEDIKDFIRNFLIRRKSNKDIRYAPTQIELRTLLIPAMNYINGVFGSYYELCKDLGYILKFNKYEFTKQAKPFLPEHKIIIDTREQNPLSFSIPTTPESLIFGDYTLNDEAFCGGCVVERKSVSDLFHTLSPKELERFCVELERAALARSNLVVLVEGSLRDVYAFPEGRVGNMRVPASTILFNVRAISQLYPYVQFLFVNNRQDASKTIERLLQSGGEYKEVDLQYLYDTGKLLDKETL